MRSFLRIVNVKVIQGHFRSQISKGDHFPYDIKWINFLGATIEELSEFRNSKIESFKSAKI